MDDRSRSPVKNMQRQGNTEKPHHPPKDIVLFEDHPLLPVRSSIPGYAQRSSSNATKIGDLVRLIKGVYFCGQCKIRMEIEGDFKKHLDRHTYNNLYRCFYCPTLAPRKSSIQTHIVNDHPGKEERFGCITSPVTVDIINALHDNHNFRPQYKTYYSEQNLTQNLTPAENPLKSGLAQESGSAQSSSSERQRTSQSKQSSQSTHQDSHRPKASHSTKKGNETPPPSLAQPSEPNQDTDRLKNSKCKEARNIKPRSSQSTNRDVQRPEACQLVEKGLDRLKKAITQTSQSNTLIDLPRSSEPNGPRGVGPQSSQSRSPSPIKEKMLTSHSTPTGNDRPPTSLSNTGQASQAKKTEVDKPLASQPTVPSNKQHTNLSKCPAFEKSSSDQATRVASDRLQTVRSESPDIDVEPLNAIEISDSDGSDIEITGESQVSVPKKAAAPQKLAQLSMPQSKSITEANKNQTYDTRMQCVYEAGSYMCKSCGITSSSPEHFSHHIYSHLHSSRVRGHNCPYCTVEQYNPDEPLTCVLVEQFLGILNKQKDAINMSQSKGTQRVSVIEDLTSSPQAIVITEQDVNSVPVESVTAPVIPVIPIEPIKTVQVPPYLACPKPSVKAGPNPKPIQAGPESVIAGSTPGTISPTPPATVNPASLTDVSSARVSPNPVDNVGLVPTEKINMMAPVQADPTPGLSISALPQEMACTTQPTGLQNTPYPSKMITAKSASNDPECNPYVIKPITEPEVRRIVQRNDKESILISSSSETEESPDTCGLQQDPTVLIPPPKIKLEKPDVVAEPVVVETKKKPQPKSIVRCYHDGDQFVCDRCKYSVHHSKPKVFRKHLWFELHPDGNCNHNPGGAQYNRFKACPVMYQLMIHLLDAKAKKEMLQKGKDTLDQESSRPNTPDAAPLRMTSSAKALATQESLNSNATNATSSTSKETLSLSKFNARTLPSTTDGNISSPSVPAPQIEVTPNTSNPETIGLQFLRKETTQELLSNIIVPPVTVPNMETMSSQALWSEPSHVQRSEPSRDTSGTQALNSETINIQAYDGTTTPVDPLSEDTATSPMLSGAIIPAAIDSALCHTKDMPLEVLNKGHKSGPHLDIQTASLDGSHSTSIVCPAESASSQIAGPPGPGSPYSTPSISTESNVREVSSDCLDVIAMIQGLNDSPPSDIEPLVELCPTNSSDQTTVDTIEQVPVQIRESIPAGTLNPPTENSSKQPSEHIPGRHPGPPPENNADVNTILSENKEPSSANSSSEHSKCYSQLPGESMALKERNWASSWIRGVMRQTHVTQTVSVDSLIHQQTNLGADNAGEISAASSSNADLLPSLGRPGNDVERMFLSSNNVSQTKATQGTTVDYRDEPIGNNPNKSGNKVPASSNKNALLSEEDAGNSAESMLTSNTVRQVNAMECVAVDHIEGVIYSVTTNKVVEKAPIPSSYDGALPSELQTGNEPGSMLVISNVRSDSPADTSQSTRPDSLIHGDTDVRSSSPPDTSKSASQVALINLNMGKCNDTSKNAETPVMPSLIEDASPSEDGMENDVESTFLISNIVSQVDNSASSHSKSSSLPGQTNVDPVNGDNPIAAPASGQTTQKDADVAQTEPYARKRPTKEVKCPVQSPSQRTSSRQLYVCPFFNCSNWKSNNADSYKSHNLRHHHNMVNFPCAFCLRQFGTSDFLILHIDRVHTEPQKIIQFRPYHCGFKRCFFACDKAADFLNHFHENHSCALSYPCCFCKHKCSTIAGLVVHIDDSVKYSCTVCSTLRSTDEDIKKHIESSPLSHAPHNASVELMIKVYLTCILSDKRTVRYTLIDRFLQLTQPGKIPILQKSPASQEAPPPSGKSSPTPSSSLPQETFKCTNCYIAMNDEASFEKHVIQCMKNPGPKSGTPLFIPTPAMVPASTPVIDPSKAVTSIPAIIPVTGPGSTTTQVPALASNLGVLSKSKNTEANSKNSSGSNSGEEPKGQVEEQKEKADVSISGNRRKTQHQERQWQGNDMTFTEYMVASPDQAMANVKGAEWKVAEVMDLSCEDSTLGSAEPDLEETLPYADSPSPTPVLPAPKKGVLHCLGNGPTNACEKCSFSTQFRVVKAIHKRMHMHTLDVDKMLWCLYCPYSTNTMLHFKIHIQGHTESPKIRLYHCGYCPLSSNQMDCVEDHHEDVHPKLKLKLEVTRLVLADLQCPDCDVILKTEQELLEHIEELHRPTTIRKYLNEMYGIASLEVVPEKTKPIEKPEPVVPIEIKPIVKPTILDQISEDAKLILDRFQCSNCDYSCYKFGTWVRHLQRHHTSSSQEIILYCCKTCKWKSTSKEKAIYHCKLKHTEVMIDVETMQFSEIVAQSASESPILENLLGDEGDISSSFEGNSSEFITSETAALAEDHTAHEEQTTYSAYTDGDSIPGKPDVAKDSHYGRDKLLRLDEMILKIKRGSKLKNCPICPFSNYKIIIHLKFHRKNAFLKTGYKCPYCIYICTKVQSGNIGKHIKSLHPGMPVRKEFFNNYVTVTDGIQDQLLAEDSMMNPPCGLRNDAIPSQSCRTPEVTDPYSQPIKECRGDDGGVPVLGIGDVGGSAIQVGDPGDKKQTEYNEETLGLIKDTIWNYKSTKLTYDTPMFCPVCPCTPTNKNIFQHLNAHLKQATIINGYKCPYCVFTCERGYPVTRHLRLYHRKMPVSIVTVGDVSPHVPSEKVVARPARSMAPAGSAGAGVEHFSGTATVADYSDQFSDMPQLVDYSSQFSDMETPEEYLNQSPDVTMPEEEDEGIPLLTISAVVGSDGSQATVNGHSSYQHVMDAEKCLRSEIECPEPSTATSDQFPQSVEERCQSMFCSKVDGMDLYRCKLCVFMDSDTGKVYNHFITRHRDHCQFQCGHCEFRSVAAFKIQQHAMVNHSALDVKVKLVQMESTEDKETLNDKDVVNGSANLSEDSEYLQNEAYERSPLFRLSNFIKTSEDNIHMCKVCGTEKRSKQNMATHIMSIHLKFYPFACKHCSYSALSGYLIRKHCIKFHPNLAPEAIRKEMPENLPSMKSLDNENLIILSAKHLDKLSSCDSNTEENPDEYPDEIVRTNAVEKSENSDTQRAHDKTVGYTLVRHKTSFAKKAYMCGICEYASNWSLGDVQVHVIRNHLNLHPYSCRYCRKGYWKLLVLQEHYQTTHPKLPECAKIDRARILSALSTIQDGNNVYVGIIESQAAMIKRTYPERISTRRGKYNRPPSKAAPSSRATSSVQPSPPLPHSVADNRPQHSYNPKAPEDEPLDLTTPTDTSVAPAHKLQPETNTTKPASMVYEEGKTYTLYECTTCKSRHAQKIKAELHYSLKHLGMEPYRCPYCSFHARSHQEVISHATHNHPDREAAAFAAFQDNPLAQDKIQEVRVTVRKLNVSAAEHKKTADQQSSVEPEPVRKGAPAGQTLLPTIMTCHVCCTKLNSWEAMDDHMMTSHPDYNGFQCCHCAIYMTAKHSILTHLAKFHSNILVRKYKCIKDGEPFGNPIKCKSLQQVGKGKSKIGFANIAKSRMNARQKHVPKEPAQSIDEGEEPQRTASSAAGTDNLDRAKNYNFFMEIRKMRSEHKGNGEKLRLHCKQCSYNTFSTTCIRYHVMSHTNYRPAKCPVCPQRAIRRKAIMKHMQMKHPEMPRIPKQIIDPEKEISLRSKFIVKILCENSAHVLKESTSASDNKTKPNSRKTDDEGDAPRKKAKLDKSSARDDDTEEAGDVYLCVLCGKQGFNKSGILQHIMTEKNYRPWACPHCAYRDVLLEGAQNHCSLSHPLKKFKLVIKEEPEQMAMIRDLVQRSKVSRSAMMETTFVEQVNLDETSSSQSQLSMDVSIPVSPQVQQTHNESTIYQCKHCPYRTNNKAGLQSHKVRHGPRHVKCGYCDRTAFYKSEILQHQKLSHADCPPYVLSLTKPGQATLTAESKSTQSDDVRAPLAMKDPDLQSSDDMTFVFDGKRLTAAELKRVPGEGFACQLCPATYTSCQLRRAKIHVIKSHFPPLWKCGYCDKRYSLSDEMKGHIRSSHSPLSIKYTAIEPLEPPVKRNSTDQSKGPDSPPEIADEKSSGNTFGVIEGITITDAHLKMTSSGQVQCKTCSRLFNMTQLETAKFHVVRSHLPHRWKCGHCNRTKALVVELRKHIRSVHAGLPVRILRLDTEDSIPRIATDDGANVTQTKCNAPTDQEMVIERETSLSEMKPSKLGPTCSKPGPAYSKPGPACSKPGPACSKPGPACSKPAALKQNVDPLCMKRKALPKKPGPACSKATLLHSKPGPACTKSTPSHSKPGPACSKVSSQDKSTNSHQKPGPASCKKPRISSLSGSSIPSVFCCCRCSFKTNNTYELIEHTKEEHTDKRTSVMEVEPVMPTLYPEVMPKLPARVINLTPPDSSDSGSVTESREPEEPLATPSKYKEPPVKLFKYEARPAKLSKYKESVGPIQNNFKAPKLQECSYCAFSSFDSWEFKLHKQEHEEQRPYQCAHCDFSAYVRASVRKHCRNQHMDKPVTVIDLQRSSTGTEKTLLVRKSRSGHSPIRAAVKKTKSSPIRKLDDSKTWSAANVKTPLSIVLEDVQMVPRTNLKQLLWENNLTSVSF